MEPRLDGSSAFAEQPSPGPFPLPSTDLVTAAAESGRAAARRLAFRWSWPEGLHHSIVLTDVVVIALSLAFARSVRFGVPALAPLHARSYTVLSIGIGLLWLFMLATFRTRDIRRLGAGTKEFQLVTRATLSTFGLVAVAATLVRVDIARGYLLIALPVGLAALLLSRALWRSWLGARRRDGRCLTGAFVIGDRADATRVVQELLARPKAGYKPIGVAFAGGRRGGGDLADLVPVVDVDDVPDLVRATGSRAVIVAGNLPGGHERVRNLSWRLENSQTELILVSSLTEVAGPRIHMRPVEGLPMLHVDLPQYEGINHTIKRGIDLVLGGLAVLLLSPVLAVVALAVKLDSRGPVLFRQERVGVAGTLFTMYKFRSMAVDAEARLAELAAGNEGSGLLFKLRNDPRVTPVGRFIRRYSLDELPQLFNVLNGTMSLVGPRPPLPREVAEYEDRVHRRLLIKPGITGLWQVSGRSNLSWEESVKLDLYYVENWSVLSDFVVLLRTVRAVLRRDGAY